MDMKPTLTMSQKQMLVMTPKLQQAIKILQMPRLELSQYITQQLTENPVLEEVDDVVEDPEEETENLEDEIIDEIPESDVDLDTGLPETDSVTENDLPETDIVNDDFGDIDWKEYFEDSDIENSEWEEPMEDDRRDNSPALEESLQDHLLWQLRMSDITDKEYEIGEAIIGEINDDGYLTEDIDELAKDLGYETADVEKVLHIIQGFDPTGVGARDLRECLLIQLKQLNLEGTIPYRIIDEGYLKELEANKYPQIAKSLGVSIDLVKDAIKIISSLEPKPGRQYSPVRNEYIIPDVIVEKIDGKYTVMMNDFGPRLTISPYYKNILTSGEPLQEDTKKYIQSQLESASWFLESLERRRKTILKVTEAIFEVQKDFLEKGPKYLKPLVLRDVADAVGVHEGTVSRVVNNRYVQTPQGIFELKHFFSSGISTKDGQMTSSTSVKEMIKNLIDTEDPKNPLSDNEIEIILKKKGLNIARRTIAKYRKELNIPPSSKRKQW
ncbi:TPA: RNA polymerase sigma-54 factor [Candidatus Poribacteria bacterium]|nr:RNA polymerase sigma-54 factor [Candidatus Poribacteria bacterium]